MREVLPSKTEDFFEKFQTDFDFETFVSRKEISSCAQAKESHALPADEEVGKMKVPEKSQISFLSFYSESVRDVLLIVDNDGMAFLQNYFAIGVP